MFGWRQMNGAWAVRAARQLLVRLERRGLFELPAPRRRQGRPAAVELEAAEDLEKRAPTGAPADSGASRGRLHLRLAERGELGWRRACMQRFHYLGDRALVGESLRCFAELDGSVAALLSWGSASLRNGPRDRYVGWDVAARRANLHLVVNNARFLILPWARRPNLASQALGANLRRLRRDWRRVLGHEVVLAETFVDSARFRGVCCRASNWIYVGQTNLNHAPHSGFGSRFGRICGVNFTDLVLNIALLCLRPNRLVSLHLHPPRPPRSANVVHD